MALAGIIGVHLVLPESLTLGPTWLVPTLVFCLAIPVVLSHRSGRHSLNQRFAYILLGLVTASLAWSLTQLVSGLPSHRESPQILLRAAAALWVANILVFASWYWRLDAGGPHMRDMREDHDEGAFLFPQMSIEGKIWRPGFVDYLFLAFNTSTALSPTDAPVLSRWAKMAMMAQALISLTTVVILAARAVNIL